MCQGQLESDDQNVPQNESSEAVVVDETEGESPTPLDSSSDTATASRPTTLERQKSDHVGDKRSAKMEGERGSNEIKHHKTENAEPNAKTLENESVSVAAASAAGGGATKVIPQDIARPERDPWWAPLVTPSFGLKALGVACGIVGVVLLLSAVETGDDSKSDAATSKNGRAARR
jgi:hypothetical protein